MSARDNFVMCGLGVALLAFTGCSEESRDFAGDKEVTVPVTGMVTLDGEPVFNLNVVAVPLGDANGRFNVAMATKPDGTFAMTTYRDEDGLRLGEWALTFKRVKMAVPEAIDLLGGKYSNAQSSEYKFTVEEGKPLEFNDIALTTP